MTEPAARPATTIDDPPVLAGTFAVRGGIVEAIGRLDARNRAAAAFYDGPGWRRFRPWERLFLALHGGERRARREVLRHLPTVVNARVLEVGIGDGANLPLLPPGWEIHGVDIARTRLVACFGRFPAMAGRLAWARGEDLPYQDGSFDACFSMGGFNDFGDHAAALRELRRVTRPGGTLIVADEATWLLRCGIGHLLGVPAVDRWWLRALGLDRAFLDLVFDRPSDLDATVRAAWPGAERCPIWAGLGYCYVDR